MPHLTRDEAATRAALLTVESYRIELDITGAESAGDFTSSTVITFDCASPGTTTFVEVAATAVEEIRLNGRDLDRATWIDGRIPLPDLAARNEVSVRARMPYSGNGEGLHRFVDPEDGETYLYAMAGPANAARIFACFDQPDLKASFSLTVVADPRWTVWANGAALSGDGSRPGTVEFAPTKRFSTYLMTMVAGPFHTLYDEYNGIPLGLLARRSLAATLDDNAAEILEITRQSFDWYHRVFGIRYPFGNYFQAFVPEFNWGAVENPGCVNFREEMLFRDRVTETERETRAMVIAHEMAHMWFGDLVTLRWWEDIWLNEAFAEYMGWRVASEATRFTDVWTTFAIARKAWGYRADQRPSTHPVSPPEVPDAGQAMANFDGISYAKGASVLRQLNAWVGDEAFFAGLRSYFGEHAYGNASLADLLAALSKASGRDLTAWATVWLNRSQVNTLRPEIAYADDGSLASLTIEQTAPPEHPTLRPHHIGIAVYDPARTFAAGVDVTGERSPVPSIAGAAPGVVLLNDGDLGYAKIRFDARSRDLLPRVLPRLDDSLAQALAWAAAADATRDAEWTPQEFLDLVVSALPGHGTDDRVLEHTLTFTLNAVVDRFLPPGRRSEAQARVLDVCLRELRDAKPGGSRQLIAARAAISASGAGDADRLTGWLDGHDVPGGLVVDTELRWSLLHRLAVIGVVDDARITAETNRDTSARGAEHAARARAALPESAAKQRAWSIITSGTGLSTRLIEATADGFWQPEQADLTAPYVERYFADILRAPADRGQAATATIARLAYPAFAVEPSTLASAEKLLRREDLTRVLHRSVTDATDELTIALTARATLD